MKELSPELKTMINRNKRNDRQQKANAMLTDNYKNRYTNTYPLQKRRSYKQKQAQQHLKSRARALIVDSTEQQSDCQAK